MSTSPVAPCATGSPSFVTTWDAPGNVSLVAPLELGEELPTALWQSLLCFVAVTVFTLVVGTFQGRGGADSGEDDSSDP